MTDRPPRPRNAIMIDNAPTGPKRGTVTITIRDDGKATVEVTTPEDSSSRGSTAELGPEHRDLILAALYDPKISSVIAQGLGVAWVIAKRRNPIF